MLSKHGVDGTLSKRVNYVMLKTVCTDGTSSQEIPSYVASEGTPSNHVSLSRNVKSLDSDTWFGKQNLQSGYPINVPLGVVKDHPERGGSLGCHFTQI